MSGATFRQLLRGKGAHVDAVAAIADVSAAVAGRTVQGYPHSISQIVGHMNYWMEYELRRIAGERPAYPEHAIESWPSALAPASEAEWVSVRKDLATRLDQLSALSESAPDVLNAPLEAMHVSEESRSTSVQAVLWQILVHNSYHAGQIALMLRCFGLWPPRTGGDTW